MNHFKWFLLEWSEVDVWSGPSYVFFEMFQSKLLTVIQLFPPDWSFCSIDNWILWEYELFIFSSYEFFEMFQSILKINLTFKLNCG